MENAYDHRYQTWLENKFKAELSFKDQQLAFYRQRNEDLRAMLKSQIEQIELYKQLMVSKTFIAGQLSDKSFDVNITNIVESKSMSDSIDSSRKVEVGNIGGDFNASGQALNLGNMDISGEVTNTIEQLSDSPKSEAQSNLKELLFQLQKAIENSLELSMGEKALLLEQVKTLAEAKLTNEPEKKENLAKKARGMFEAVLKGLPDTAKIVESIGKLLPMILQALGLTL
jgi:hypothetical protein